MYKKRATVVIPNANDASATVLGIIRGKNDTNWSSRGVREVRGNAPTPASGLAGYSDDLMV